MLDKHSLDIDKHNALYNGVGDVAEDGETLYSIKGGYKSSSVTLEELNVKTGESATLGKADLPHITGNGRGLVPGGKYFFISDPGMYIYDCSSVKTVAQKRMKNWDLLHTTFSPQGSFYAVAAGARRMVGDNLAVYDPKTPTLIRVQETIAGKTVFAFPAHSRWVKDIKFSPDGKKLAIVTDDGYIEIWNLPFVKS